MKKYVLFATTLIFMTGCATTNTIAPSYVNPNNYANYDCASLQSEVNRVSQLATQTQNQQTKLSATGIGIGVTAGRGGIYPSIGFGLGKGANSNQKKDTLSKIYGEHDAMIIAARQKNCSFANNIKIYGE